MSFIGALGNNNESGGGNNTFNFNDLKIRKNWAQFIKLYR